MPESFPVVDPTSGELRDVPHYSVAEVAGLLHMGTTTAYRLMHDEGWPHLQIAKRAWISAPDLAAILQGMRRNDDGTAHLPEPEPDAPRHPLGLALPPDPAPVNGPDGDPGGVR